MPGPKRWREGAGLVLTGNLASVIGKNIVIVEIDFGNNFGIFGFDLGWWGFRWQLKLKGDVSRFRQWFG